MQARLMKIKANIKESIEVIIFFLLNSSQMCFLIKIILNVISKKAN